MGTTGSNKETPLSAVRMYEMEILPSKALDMNESVHLTIDYVLRGECREFRV